MQMAKKLLIPSAICLLAVALWVMLLPPKKKNGKTSPSGSSAAITRTQASTERPSPEETDIGTKREREDPGAALALRKMEKEFDELLPAQFPDQFSSLCDVTLNPGESIVLGGFKKADGNYEFTMITVTPNDSEEMEGQYTVKPTTMVLTPEKSSELGLGALVSPARTRIQKSIIIPTAGTITGAGGYVGIMTGPYVTAPADTPSSISLGNSERAHVISTMISPQEGGYSIRLRTRIESPYDFP